MTFAKHIRAKHILHSTIELTNVVNLTASQQESDIVANLIIDRINMLKECDASAAFVEGKLFVMCDPDIPATSAAFKELNITRNDRRRFKHEISVLEKFLAKLKKQSSANTSAAAVMNKYLHDIETF